LGQSIGRWGNFVNQEAFGTNTTLPWGMTSDVVKQELLRNMDKLGRQGITVDPNIPVHPTFLYESIWDISVFLLLIWYRKRKKLNGEVFFLYMVLYGAGRFFIEALRTDSLMIGNLRVSQVLAFVFVVVFGILLIVRRKKVVESAESAEIGASSYGAVLKKMQDGENEDNQGIDEDDTDIKAESNKEQE
jgi:phosphatidylglycerol:prolipoprotein diacylglycerol transferase